MEVALEDKAEEMEGGERASYPGYKSVACH
jgi:hypothetical protein